MIPSPRGAASLPDTPTTLYASFGGDLPLADEVFDLISRIKRYERLTVEAAVQGSYEMALDALSVHPLVESVPLARSILDGYVQGLGDLLPPLS